MFNYKRLTFVFVFMSVFLLATDTQMEKQLRRNLLSLFDIVVEEGSQVGETAPSSFLDTLESSRIGTYNFLNNQGKTLAIQSESKKGIVSAALSIVYYIVTFLKFLTSYIITFYPAVIFLIYMFLTSRFFRRDEFGYDNF